MKKKLLSVIFVSLLSVLFSSCDGKKELSLDDLSPKEIDTMPLLGTSSISISFVKFSGKLKPSWFSCKIEANAPETFYEIHKVCRALKISAPKLDKVFETLEETIQSDKVETAYKVNVDGIIDEVNQGNTGDCYLLSAIRALVSTAAGKELISNAITWANDYSSVTIYFAGKNKYITLTAEEIIAADNGDYSWGDNDVLILELAMEKLIGYDDLDDGGSAKDFWKKFLDDPEYHRDRPHGLDDLGNAVWGWISGSSGSVDISSDTVLSRLQQMWQRKQAGQNVAATCAFYTFNDTTYTWHTVDGEEYSYTANGSDGAFTNTGTGHEFAITNITATTVTFANPHNSEAMSYTVTWEEFAHMGLSEIEVIYF